MQNSLNIKQTSTLKS